MKKYNKTIEQLLDSIGGKDNIKNFEHCATRLRVILKDDSKFDKEKADAIEESKGYFFSTGQHQFIFGTGKVNDVTDELTKFIGTEETSHDSMKEDVYANLNPVQKAVRILADILVPLIPALVTTGLLMGVRGLLVELGMTMTEEVTQLFSMLTDTAFAFLPVLIAYSATRKFGGNPLIGIVVGLMMVAPQLPNAYAVRGGTAEGLNILGISVYGYQGSIFPAILAGWMVSKLEKWLRSWVPEIMDLVVTPFLTITLTIAAILFVLGPIIQTIESTVLNGIIKVINAPFGIGYILFGGLQQLIVVTGLHHSIGLIEINLLSDVGVNVIQPLTTASMAGQFGAAIGTAFLMKDKLKRSNMISASLPTLFGITEPLLFGVNLRSLRVFISGIIGGAVGGLITYILKLAATGMGITFIPGLLLYTNSLSALLQYILVMVVSFVVGFLFVQLQGKQIRKEI